MTRPVVLTLAVLALSTAGCASALKSAHDGDLAAVNAYLAKGGSVSERVGGGGCDGCALLHAAADGGQAEVARALLDRGADVNAPADHGLTPLHFAVGGQSAATVRLLLERGARPSLAARDEWSNTPLLRAAGTVRRLETTTITPFGAVGGGEQAAEPSGEVIAALLDAGAEINAASAKGNTPLHIAAYRGYAGAVRLLLSRGADRTLRNAGGQTAEALAAQFGQAAVVTLLKAP